MRSMANRRFDTPALVLVACCLLWAIAGCSHVPARRVTSDRMAYGEVIAESWKRQTLMNVVRLRHADTPLFLEVSGIINSYSVSQKGSLGRTEASGAGIDTLTLGAEGNWSNTPTVTYQPLTGDRFTRSLLQPVPPASVFQLLQGGWPPELVLRTVVTSINGLKNTTGGAPADPRFDELIAAMSRLQQSGALGFRVEARPGGSALVMAFSPDQQSPAVVEDSARIHELLRIDAGVREFEVSYGLIPRDGREIALLTRSMMELLLQLGVGIDLPDGAVEQGRALPTRVPESQAMQAALVQIRSGPKEPEDAYVSVPYKKLWYWIDDTDMPSKRNFTFLLILFSLAETGQAVSAPVVTVPSR